MRNLDAVASSVNLGVGGLKHLVYDYRPGEPRGEAGVSGELGVGPNAGRRNDEFCLDGLPRSSVPLRVHHLPLPRLISATRRPRPDPHPFFFQVVLNYGGNRRGEDPGHHLVFDFHQVGLDTPQIAEGFSHFAADRAGADDNGRFHFARRNHVLYGHRGVKVGDRGHPRKVDAGNRRSVGSAAGCNHQPVVGQLVLGARRQVEDANVPFVPVYCDRLRATLTLTSFTS